MRFSTLYRMITNQYVDPPLFTCLWRLGLFVLVSAKAKPSQAIGPQLPEQTWAIGMLSLDIDECSQKLAGQGGLWLPICGKDEAQADLDKAIDIDRQREVRSPRSLALVACQRSRPWKESCDPGSWQAGCASFFNSRATSVIMQGSQLLYRGIRYGSA